MLYSRNRWREYILLLPVSEFNPKLKTFFQRPKDKIPADGHWFDNQVIDEHTIVLEGGGGGGILNITKIKMIIY